MLKQYEELAVLEQGDDGAIVSIRGQGGPAVLLGVAYLAHLELVVRKAKAELQATSPAGRTPSALQLLCSEVETLLVTHREACNKYEGGASADSTVAAALEELNELRRMLEGTRRS